MNYKIALSAAFVAAVGLTGCDSRNTVGRNSDYRNSDVTSGATTAAPNNSGTSANAPVDVNNKTGTGTQEGDYANATAAHEQEMTDRKVNPDHARRAKAKHKAAAKPAQPASGSTSSGAIDSNDDLDRDDDISANDDVYHDNESGIDDDNSVSSGSTSEPVDDAKVSYRQTDLPGGMTAQDRNLRYGLIGNGTGQGMEDTTSKFMTDNYTLSDPTISNHAALNSGALSAPTADQDALKDIKSGTTFDADHYDIEE